MNFIKKIFDGKIDDKVHLQFQKFSRGEFRNRAEIQAKNSNGKYAINTSADFANDLVTELSKKLGDKITNVSGAVISTSDLTGKLDFKNKKQFQGVKIYVIDKEMSGHEILKLLDEFPKTFFALSFLTEDSILKIKPKAPMSGKPKGNKTSEEGGKKKKPDFCKLKTSDRQLAEDFIFESLNFKNAEISHTYIINEIKIPSELKDEKNFAAIRERALRKGKIIREAIIDGKQIIEEKEFEA